MLLKSYEIIWATILAIVALLLVTGSFTLTTLATPGFVSFGMLFTGVLCVMTLAAAQNEPDDKIRTSHKKSGIFDSKRFAAR